MNCPACGNALEGMTVADITVDVCNRGCGGIWFDRFELQKVDEPRESAGESLLEIEKDQGISVDHSRRRKCPKCTDIIMMRHFFSPKRQVEVDECPSCAGFWLDCGELGRIRSLFDSEEERQKAAAECFSEIFGQHVAQMRAGSEGKRETAKKIAWMFRFICPSYYIPGKQDWGAF
jgi:Zn-finger nucleic acid-binding protein